MNEPDRWSRPRISPEAFDAQCQAAGLPADDAATVSEFLRKAQSGRRLAPRWYRNFKFQYDYDPVV
ncbi:hypothetical protein [Rhodococcus sp. USK13]|uniref:hypothetical protein n=1 Tax=Rhodococcus sp. USK13 TaxID=2806442 RepID=UPI001BD102AE|nr:hypothetical protein [Rhodococcus sp. USK13]